MQVETIVKANSWTLEINGFPAIYAMKVTMPTFEREVLEIPLGFDFSPVPVNGARKRYEATVENMVVKANNTAAQAWFESGLPQDITVKLFDSLGIVTASYQFIGAICPKIEIADLEKSSTDFLMQTLTITMANVILK
jgi:hypothetical protein